MANKVFVIKIDGAEKAFDDINKINEALGSTMGTSSAKHLEETLKDLRLAYSELNEVEQNSDLGRGLQEQINNYQLAVASSTQTLREHKEEIERTIALRETEEGSIEQMKLQVEQLNKQYEEMSEAERESAAGSELQEKLQALREELTEVEAFSKSHLATLGSMGRGLQAISDGFENANSVVSSYSGILSSTSDVLKVFGVENKELEKTLKQLETVSKTINSLQTLHTQLVAKDSIVLKTAVALKKAFSSTLKATIVGLKEYAIVQKAMAWATSLSSTSLKGFKVALISTGIGAIVVALGLLIANFDEIKKAVQDNVPGLKDLGETMDKLKAIAMGVGEALMNYVMTPFKVLGSLITGNLDQAWEDLKNGLSVAENYQKGYDKQAAKNQEEKIKEAAKKRAKDLDDYIKNTEAKKGEDWKYTEEGIKKYNEYFDQCLKMYDKDTEEYKEAQREKDKFNLLSLKNMSDAQRQARIDNLKEEIAVLNAQQAMFSKSEKAYHEIERRKQGFKDSIAELEQYQKKANNPTPPSQKPDDYLKNLKEIQKGTDELYTKLEERDAEHYKKLAEQVAGHTDSLEYLKQAAKIELNIQQKKQLEELYSLDESQREKTKHYKEGDERKIRLDEEFENQKTALVKKHGKERSDLTLQHGKSKNAAEEKIKEASLNQTLQGYQKEIDALNQFIKEKKEAYDNAKKDLAVKGTLGLIDVKATKKNYDDAKKADEQYLKDLFVLHMNKGILLKKQLEAAKGNKNEEKKINDQIKAENESYTKEINAIQKRMDDNTEASTNLQLQYYQELHEKLTEIWGKISEGMSAAFEMANTIMQQQMEEAKVKLEEVTKQYDTVVEKRKESLDKLKALEDEATTASGGRAIVVQEQIARQMEANEELAIQEKDLKKQKEKQEKDLAKKEKEAQKIALKQKLIETIANTALGVTKAILLSPFTLGLPWSALIAASGAIQAATISRQISKLEDGGLLNGKRHSQGGMRIEGTNIEVEGDEYVVNRISTRKNLGLIDYINKQRRELSPGDLSTYFSRNGQSNATPQHSMKQMYEQGGQLTNLELLGSPTAPDNDRILEAISRINFRPVVSVVDIANTQNNLTEVKDIAGV